MEQKNWTIAMEGLVEFYTAKCEALQDEVLALKNTALRTDAVSGVTASLIRADRDHVRKLGEKNMALELENAAKDKRIAKLRNTIDILEINMRELEKRVLPSTETHFLHMKEERDSWKEKCARMHSEIQRFNNYKNQRQSEIDALRHRLADSENTVAQLRAARDKRRSNSFEEQLDTVVSKAKADALAACDGLVKEAIKSIAAQDCAAFNAMGSPSREYEATYYKIAEDYYRNCFAKANEVEAADNDGWIECHYLPINQWCDVKRADGTMDRVCRPEVRGVQQDAEITHYRPAKKEAKPKQGDGWIEWHGGECPVDSDCFVEIKRVNGVVFQSMADNVDWSLVHLYRVLFK